MTKEQAMEYLKIAAKVTEDAYNLAQMEDEEGRSLFITGRNMYEIHMYDNNAFIDMAKALEKPFSINPDWCETKGCCKFYTHIDGWEKHEWEIFTLYEKAQGWPNA